MVKIVIFLNRHAIALTAGHTCRTKSQSPEAIQQLRELLLNAVYGESSGFEFLVSILFNAVNELNPLQTHANFFRCNTRFIFT